jgi:hypothetical protein
MNYFAEYIIDVGTVIVYGRTPEDVHANAAHFRREFIGQRWKRGVVVRSAISNSNGMEYRGEIIFSERWRRNGDFDVSALRGHHSNRDNAAFASFLHRLTKEEVLIDRVVLHQFDEDVVLCQKCYVVDVILFKDHDAGQGKIRFNSRRYADYRDPATIECLVSQIDHIWI